MYRNTIKKRNIKINELEDPGHGQYALIWIDFKNISQKLSKQFISKEGEEYCYIISVIENIIIHLEYTKYNQERLIYDILWSLLINWYFSNIFWKNVLWIKQRILLEFDI